MPRQEIKETEMGPSSYTYICMYSTFQKSRIRNACRCAALLCWARNDSVLLGAVQARIGVGAHWAHALSVVRFAWKLAHTRPYQRMGVWVALHNRTGLHRGIIVLTSPHVAFGFRAAPPQSRRDAGTEVRAASAARGTDRSSGSFPSRRKSHSRGACVYHRSWRLRIRR